MTLRPHYSLLSLLILTVLTAVSVKLWYKPPYDTPLVWKWSIDKACLAYSTEQHLPDFDVERSGEGLFRDLEGTLKIRSKEDGKLIYSYQKYASEHAVFTRWQNMLYVAEYSPVRTGCEVVAVDLKSGKELWRTKLQGIGPITDSKYENLVNIETDGEVIIVAGNEASGRYVEHLDIKTGKFLGNKQFESDPNL